MKTIESTKETNDNFYCFMRDMYTLEQVNDICKASYYNHSNIKKRKVANYTYRDPDVNCRPLYDKIKDVFLNSAYPNALVNNDPYCAKQLVIYLDKKKDIRFSSDYLGPSVTSAWYAKLENEYVWESILMSRTIGGHILWPRIRTGINQSKASTGCKGTGISDRADIAFYELKNYLNNINDKCYNKKLRNSFLLTQNQNWFEDKKIFACNPKGKFESFCDFFKLKDSFVDENYNINWFIEPEIDEVNYDVMKEYFKNNIEAIQKRNKLL